MGSQGVLLYNVSTTEEVGKFTHYPAQAIQADQILSEIGAGDCFLGGYLAKLLTSKSGDTGLTEADQAQCVEVGQRCAKKTLMSDRNVSEAINSGVLDLSNVNF